MKNEYAIVIWREAGLFAHTNAETGQLETYSDLVAADAAADAIENATGHSTRVISIGGVEA